MDFAQKTLQELVLYALINACIPFVNLNNNNMLQFLVTGACV